MCVIIIKEKGQALPSIKMLKDAWDANPHGAGYMFTKKDGVHIHKGFMSFNEFYNSLCKNVNTSTPAVMHFRISTQAGISQEMTHPYPYTKKLENTKLLNCICDLGIAHNGIIPLTSNPNEKEYNDTALFITQYLTEIVKSFRDLQTKSNEIARLIGFSKLAFLDKNGRIYTIGEFKTYKNYKVSNLNFVQNYIYYCNYYQRFKL